jgi:hypothetical protein
MKREYIRPFMEVEKISAGGMLMDSPFPPYLPSAGGAPERRGGKEPAF